MAQLYDMLRSVKGHSMIAYYLDDVLLLLSAKQRRKLQKWIVGRVTLEMKNGREVIYRYDLEHFFDSVTR